MPGDHRDWRGPLAAQRGGRLGVGLPEFPAPSARGWWQVKGIRDIASGLVGITTIFAAPEALGWILLVVSIVPIGDAFLVLTNGGDRRAAWGVHGATALVMLVGAVLMLAS